MISDEIAKHCRLTDDELRELFPREHLEALVFGYMIRPKILGGIMLRARDLSDPSKRVFYRCTEYYRFKNLVQCQWCLFMRNDSVLRKACEDCDQFAFDIAEECARDLSWEGFAYLCKGGLIDFVVPMRISRTSDFIGVAFHGQFRPHDGTDQTLTARLRCFRRNVASALGILGELNRYDGIAEPTSADTERIRAAIGKALCAPTAQVGEGQGYILTVPIAKMKELYQTAPMLKCSDQILINLPGTRHAWRSDPACKNEILSKARLTSVEFRPVGPDGKAVEGSADMLESCKSLASIVVRVAVPTVEQKIEQYVSTRVFELLMGVREITSFWCLAAQISDLLASWLQGSEVVVARTHRAGDGDQYVINVLSRSASHKTPASVSHDTASCEATVADVLPEFSRSPGQLCALVSELADLGSAQDFFVLAVKRQEGEKPGCDGFILLIPEGRPPTDHRDLETGRYPLGIIARAMNERYAQLVAREELKQQVEAHKKALMCITHTIQRPLVDINGGITYLRSFGNLNNQVKRWLSHIKHATEDAQILSGCMSKIFRALLRKESIVEFKDDVIAVAEEVRSLAKRMRLFEKGDTEREQFPNKKGLSIEYIQTVSDVKVKADRQTFLFVMYNLLDNAIKYSLRGGTIIVEYGIEHDINQLCLKVRSKGERVPIARGQEDLPFEMFWRGQDQPAYRSYGRTFYPGLGVGLWACRFLLNAQGGHIWLVPHDSAWGDDRLNVFAVRFPQYKQT